MLTSLAKVMQTSAKNDDSAANDLRMRAARCLTGLGAQADALASSVLALDDADDAGLADASVHLDAVGFEFLRHEAGGAHFLEADLGMSMNIAADFRHAIRKTLDLLQHFHRTLQI